jgi:tetratricopeptide (TPR) repeat protein
MKITRVLPFPELRRKGGDLWQTTVIRVPAWVTPDEKDRTPYRPFAGVAVSATSGLLGASKLVHASERSPALLLAAIDHLKAAQPPAPTLIQVGTEEEAIALRATPALAGVDVEVASDLRAIRAARAEMERALSGGEQRNTFPPATEPPGVTIAALRAFAEAALAFHAAAPWRWLSNDDLIAVESPRPDPALAHAVVMGAGGEQFGVMFFPDRKAYERFVATDSERLVDEIGVWTASFWAPHELPFAEHDLWLDSQLPTTAEGDIPVAVLVGPKRRVRRASPRLLAFFEGLFRALRATSEAEIDSGHWRKQVATSQGEMAFTLALPELLDLDHDDARRSGQAARLGSERVLADIEHLLAEREFASAAEVNAFLQQAVVGRPAARREPGTPAEAAQELAYRAIEAKGRKRVALARRALELWPECADAYVVLAEAALDPEEALDFYDRAVSAGERALGPEVFREEAGHFWGVIRTRPYMRSRFGLGRQLWALGRREQAVAHYRELLRLNPNDNQGVRHVLLPAVILAGDDRGAEELLDRYEEKHFASWRYNRALLTFRRSGDGSLARRRLTAAFDANSYVPNLLLDPGLMPDDLPDHYSPGSEEEAIIYATETAAAWAATPGAVDWLAERMVSKTKEWVRMDARLRRGKRPHRKPATMS